MINNNARPEKNDDLTQKNSSALATTDSGNDPLSSNALAPITSEHAVILRQSPSWSRGVVWTIIGVTTASIVWAAIAKIEQVVAAQGQLKPQAAVTEVHAPPVGGAIVEEVLVEDGDKVKKRRCGGYLRLRSQYRRIKILTKS